MKPPNTRRADKTGQLRLALSDMLLDLLIRSPAAQCLAPDWIRDQERAMLRWMTNVLCSSKHGLPGTGHYI